MKKWTRGFSVTCAAALLCVWSGCNPEEGLLPTGSSPVPPRPTLPPLPEAPARSGASSQKSEAPASDVDRKRKKDRKKKEDARKDDSDARLDGGKGGATSGNKHPTRTTNDVSKDETSTSFAAEINIEHEGSKIEIEGVLARPKSRDGMDLSAEEVALHVGTFSTTIPAGSFVLTETTPGSQFRFEGNVDGVNLEMIIRVLDELVWFEAAAEPAELAVISTAQVVVLRIGVYTATTTATADVR